MTVSEICWNYIFRDMNERFWGGKFRTVPVFLQELEEDKLGDFRCTPEGFNSIILGNNQGLSPKELVGVLLHEMCHHATFEEAGIDVQPHGDEWKEHMGRAGFLGLIDEYTDGADRFSDEEFMSIMQTHNRIIENEGR